MTSPAAMTSAEAAGAMARRELSSTELVGACLERIAEQEDRLGPGRSSDQRRPRRRPKAREAENPPLRLTGSPAAART